MTVCQLDPISDPRWAEFLNRNPKASVFHTPAWLAAIRDAYGYESVALTTSPPEEPLMNGVVFCQVRSWLTGSRMVSVPFADHCAPLVESAAELANLLRHLETGFGRRGWKYVELRPLEPVEAMPELSPCFGASASYCFHMLELGPSEDEIYRGFHKSCVQRKVQRATREGLSIEHGRSGALLTQLRGLLLQTRRRHQAPLQPMVWFQSLIRHFGDDLEIWIASKDKRPVAGMLTLAWKDTVVYKYGGSDAAFHTLGGMPALFWQAIRYAKARDALTFDFGRSDTDNPSLIAFKNHWGAHPSSLTYYRYSPEAEFRQSQPDGLKVARRIFTYLPDFCLTAAGRLLYRHIG